MRTTRYSRSASGPGPSRRVRGSRRGRGRPRRGAGRRAGLTTRARGALKSFRKANILAVALTAFLLLFVNDGAAQAAGEAAAAEAAAASQAGAGEAREVSVAEATQEAVGSLQALWEGFRRSLPKLGLALLAVGLGWIVARVVRRLVAWATHGWERSQAFSALAGIGVWLVVIGLSASVLAGDLRALVGSLGLIGLALSWALQTPIESFTGWLLNSFQGYYRVSDRVSVGEVFGDVVKIDFLTTTVWEIGAPHRPGFVHSEQPTGRVVTFPNSEVLTGTIVNLTRDFPYVWDEFTVAVTNESELRHAMALLARTATELLGPIMAEPAEHYRRILWVAGLQEPVAAEPQVFVSSGESWTDLSIRYLVPARERRKWKSELALRVAEIMALPENARRVGTAYPRRQVQTLGPDGRPQAGVAGGGELA